MKNKNVPTLEHTHSTHENLVDIVDGVRLLRGADLSALVDALPQHSRHDDGTDTPDMKTEFDKSVLDKFVHENLSSEVGEEFGLHDAWVNVYAPEDIMYAHRDWSEPRPAKTVIANVTGQAMVLFPETNTTLEVDEGDVIILDGMTNPEHEVMSVGDRVSVVGLYTYPE